MKKSVVDLKSQNVLYIVFIAIIINLGYFIMNKDSQSLFLFICISCVVYMFQKNMIIVLLYPLFIVNGLILLRRFMNTSEEGFEYSIGDSEETIKEKLYMIKWIQKNIPNLNKDEDDDIEEMEESEENDETDESEENEETDETDEMDEIEENEYSIYTKYNVSIDVDNGLVPFQRIIDDIFFIDLKDKTIDMQAINNFVNYINYISKLKTHEDKSIFEEEIDFVNKLFKNMTNDYYNYKNKEEMSKLEKE